MSRPCAGYAPDWPAFAGGDHAHLASRTNQGVGADFVIDRFNDEFGLRLPVDGQIEIAGKDLPP